MKTRIMRNTMVVFLLLAYVSVQAQELSGSYTGILEVQGMELELTYNLAETANGYAATLDVPAQGASGIELDSVVLEGDKITIKSAKMQMTYSGTLSGDRIEGTYEQMGQQYPLSLTKKVKTLPGNPDLPSSEEELKQLAAKETGTYKYSVEDYFTTPEAFSFQLSPNGKYTSYMKRRATGERDLYLKETDTQKETLLIKQEEDLIRGYYWANENRILYMQDKGGDENYHVYGVDISGANKKELTPFEGVRVNIIENLKEDDDHVIVQMNKDNPQQEEPYLLNINTGAITKLYTVKAGDPPVSSYDFDRKGNLRAINRIVDGIKMELLYKIDGEFKRVKITEFGDTFGIISFNPSSKNPDEAYVISNLDEIGRASCR